jgi:hypothetical protein
VQPALKELISMAGNRCSDCNKFVSVELDQEPEIEVDEVDDLDNGKGSLTFRVTLSKVCTECGKELSQKELSLSIDIDLTGFEEA